ncbi:NAD-dependent epimerase/dehydratase family protein [Anaerophaga thermohalophila]|uniref:NAD-dependent epimerase/dehydratase family protein n=1 Tax=Anaerophaga thermohalophila TaxID=177400 RepID=UPI0002E0F8E1|nr:NAD-dependent epimerase/dehydratase family protein [Anaerophaga thermohalophila]
MNIAISGISGLIGSALSERLLNRGDCVPIAHRFSTGRRASDGKTRWCYFTYPDIHFAF